MKMTGHVIARMVAQELHVKTVKVFDASLLRKFKYLENINKCCVPV